MQNNDKSKFQICNDLNTKSSQIHAERLKKLQIQVAPYHSPLDITTNSKYTKTQMQKTNSLNHSSKKQIIITPVQKHTYFHNQSLKNIDQQNKILFKRIQRIVKGNKKKLNPSKKNEQKHPKTVLQHLSDDQSESQINITFMADEMSKNRASRVQSKQKEIRDANLKMLERLMNMKPTISTRKMLSQTQKNKETYRRLSKFNTFLSTDSQREQSEKDSIKGSTDRNRYFSETRQKHQGEICKDCNYHTLISKKKYSAGYTKDVQNSKKNIDSYRRTVTQPIEHHSQIKLPSIISPSNSNNFTAIAINDIVDIYGPNRSKSTNNRYSQTSKYEQKQSNERKSLSKTNRSNQLTKDNPHKSYQTTKNKSAKHFTIQSSQSLKESLNQNKQQKKMIMLGRVEKLIENQLVNFVFIRSRLLYEIHVHQRSASNNEKWGKKKSEQILQQLKNHSIRAKSSSPKQYKTIKNIKESIEQKNKFEYPQGIIKPLKQSRIILNEIVGSSLFSFFDYDYNRIIEECLQLRRTFDGKMEIQLKEELYNFKEPKITTKYSNQSIRENDQDEEED